MRFLLGEKSRAVCLEKKQSCAGAKDKLGLRVHGLIVGSPGKKRADPAVLRQLCAHTLPNGKNEARPSLNTACSQHSPPRASLAPCPTPGARPCARSCW
jgi:hypothetical protein